MQKILLPPTRSGRQRLVSEHCVLFNVSVLSGGYGADLIKKEKEEKAAGGEKAAAESKQKKEIAQAAEKEAKDAEVLCVVIVAIDTTLFYNRPKRPRPKKASRRSSRPLQRTRKRSKLVEGDNRQIVNLTHDIYLNL